MSQQQGRNKEECWALGLRLDLDEQRYVLELFPESRVMLKLSEREWLEQTEFRLKKDGSLDLRSLYCRLPAQGNEPRRYHRAPRYQPLPPAPQRKQKQREPTVQTPESEVQMPEMDGPEQYRKELIARARAAYPNAAPEMAAKLDREITRRVEIVKTYQDHLLQAAREHFPNATVEERCAHLENIRREVSEYRQALEKDIQQKREPTAAARAAPSAAAGRPRPGPAANYGLRPLITLPAAGSTPAAT